MDQASPRTYTLDDLPIVLRGRVVIDPSGCWLWTGGTSDKGYGRVHIAGKLHLPHRLVARHLGILTDESLDTCHTCDVPRCCFPGHLFQGTRAQNMADCVAKGRHIGPAERRAQSDWIRLDGREIARLAITHSLRQIGRIVGTQHRTVGKALAHYLDSIKAENAESARGGQIRRAS